MQCGGMLRLALQIPPQSPLLKKPLPQPPPEGGGIIDYIIIKNRKNLLSDET